MGAGKTTVGRHLAELLGRQFLDSDHEIERKTGATIPWIFEKEGEQGFRGRETAVIDELTLKNHLVVATGGGVVKSEVNRKLLLENKDNNVLLTASFEVAYQRISMDDQSLRPLFLQHSKDEFKAIYQERMSLYQGLATTVIDTDHVRPEQVARKILCK